MLVVVDRWNRLTVNRRIRWWGRRVSEILEAGRTGYRVTPAEAGVVLDPNLPSGAITEVGEIDQDGNLRPIQGHIEGLPSVGPDEFMARKRNRLTVVVLDDTLGMRKEYSNRVAFLRELEALDRLSRAGCRVPAILDVDMKVPSLTVSFLAGPVLRESLAEAGARIRDRDFESDSELARIPNAERWAFALREARPLLRHVIDREAEVLLMDEVDHIHRLGVLIGDVKYGNIVMESRSGLPYLLDFDHARVQPPMLRWVLAPLVRRERDRVAEMLSEAA